MILRFFRLLPVLLLLLISSKKMEATHLMGGSMTYLYEGMVGPDQQYRVTLRIYRYCDVSGGGTAPLDFSMLLGIYTQDPLNPNDDKNWFRTETLNIINQSFITPPSPGINCPFNTTVCVEEGIYEAVILLPPSAGGFHLLVERCCRNGNIQNLNAPGSIGQTYYCFIPPAPVINSSPQFSDIPVPYICAGDLVTIVNNATDPDGDSLVYSFEIPYSGYSGGGNPAPDPQFDNNPYGWPIPGVIYSGGYNVNSPFGAGGSAAIDPNTGLTTYQIPGQGFYVVVVEIKEYRNGVLIAAVRRDLQLIAIACPVNAVPAISNAGGAGQTSFTVTEGQTLCFPVAFVDPDGDSLFLTSSGNIFNIAITNPPASLANASGSGFVTSQFCWSTECGMAQATPYQFVVTVTDNGCPPKVRNQIYSIKVNPSPIPPAPAVSIQQNPPGPVCIGTEVTFTAIPTFGGTAPVYQWQLNGVNVGGNSNTFISSTLNDGDIITVSMTSNSVCVNSNTANSAPVVMTVNPFAAPFVSISVLPSGPVCSGTNVTFTALPVNPGPSPVYQWTVNGVNAGTNSATFSSATLTMGSVVGVNLTSDPACPGAASNTISMVVNPVLTPTVTITGDNSGAICPGQTVNFQAFTTGGGTAPSFQWQINGVNAGSNSSSFSSSSLNNGDNVTVILTSSEACVSVPTATSNVISITVTPPTVPTVSITANPAGSVCKDDNIIFTATAVNAGAAPFYQWQVNGVNVFSGSNIFATSTLSDGDQVRVILTSSLACLSSSTANSNIITVDILPLVAPFVSISVSPSTVICAGASVTFTAVGVNAGISPVYSWQVNGVATGTTGTTFTTSSLNHLDKVRAVLTSNANCVSPPTAISNQITMSVNPIVNPSVTIASNPSGPVCAGTNITITATPVFGGATPAYSWFVNGQPAGTNSNVLSSVSFNDGDIVTVQLGSGANCAVPANVNSNQLILDIDPILTPSVNIAVSPSFPVCEGEQVTFTSSLVNEGINPALQWQVNGVTVFTGSGTFITSSLNDGDSVRLRMISSATCVQPFSVFSDTLIAEILPIRNPVISIAASPAGAVCDGDTIHFTASFLAGGISPAFEWLINGTTVSTTSGLFSAVLNHQDTVSAVMVSSYQCAVPQQDTSYIIIANILPNLTPAVSISVNPAGPVCPGDVLTFTATPVNGGALPSYQWFVNGVAAGANSPVFSTSGLTDGDFVRVRLTSSEACVTNALANSNVVQVQISPNIQPDIQITVNPAGSVCDGDTLVFSSVWTGAGITPGFVWRVNGINTGVTTADFISGQLSNGDIIDVILTSSASCALPVTDTSNQIVALIDPLLAPTAIITANPPGTFCDGQVITYSSVVTDQGLSPVYSWLLNGVSLGITADSIVSDSFLDGDTLQLVMTSSERCLQYNPAYSNLIIIDRLPPLLPVITATESICEGQEALLSLQISGGDGGPYYFEWSNGLGNDSSLILLPVQTTTYSVSVSDSCSTVRYDSATIRVFPLPEVDFITNPLSGDILTPGYNFIDRSVNAAAWNWDFGDGTVASEQFPFHFYDNAGVYTIWLVAVSDEGCVDSTFRELIVEDVLTIYIPNSFTPNDDGVNDIFEPVGHGIEGYEMAVFNRWGQEIFLNNGSDAGWDGNDQSGKPLPSGVYVYQIRLMQGAATKPVRGTVTLVR